MPETTQDFDYNIENYTVPELRDIVDSSPEDDHETLEKKIRPFIESSANNPKMLHFFQQLQHRLFYENTYYEQNYGSDDDSYDEYVERRYDDVGNILADTIHPVDMQESNGGTLPSGDGRVVIQSNHVNASPEQELGETVGGKGVVNPFFRSTYKRTLCIDSLFKKDTDSSSDFNVTLPTKLDSVVSMRLKSIDLPVKMYNITSTNNRNELYIQTFNLQQHTENMRHTVVVPPGKYTLHSLVTVINNIFSNSTTGLQYLMFDIHTETLKTSIRAKTTIDGEPQFYPYVSDNAQILSPEFYYILSFPTIQVSVDLVNCDTSEGAGTAQALHHLSLAWMLGFRKTSYTVTKDDVYEDIYNEYATKITYRAYLCSESLFNDRINEYILLDVKDFHNNYVPDGVISVTRTDYIGDSILTRIPLMSPDPEFAGIHSYNTGLMEERNYFGPVDIDKLQIRLLNKHGELYDLQGDNFSLSLEFTLKYS
jgi:hypothetical protein